MSKKFWETLAADEKMINSDAVAESSKFQRVTNRGAIAGAHGFAGSFHVFAARTGLSAARRNIGSNGGAGIEQAGD